MATSRDIKTILCWCAYASVAAGAIYIILAGTGTVAWPGACEEEEVASVRDLSGLAFRITYTNCDTFAKEEAISVYVSETQSKEGDWIARAIHRNALLFRYDPSGLDKTLPSITKLSKDHILIFVPEVSSVIFQRRIWQKVSVDYQIGRTDYP